MDSPSIPEVYYTDWLLVSGNLDLCSLFIISHGRAVPGEIKDYLFNQELERKFDMSVPSSQIFPLLVGGNNKLRDLRIFQDAKHDLKAFQNARQGVAKFRVPDPAKFRVPNGYF